MTRFTSPHLLPLFDERLRSREEQCVKFGAIDGLDLDKMLGDCDKPLSALC